MTERIEKLIEEMSLEEKARQLTQVNAVVSLSENCFYAIMIDLVDHERRLCRLDMLSRDEVSAKKTLTLSMLCDPFSQIVR